MNANRPILIGKNSKNGILMFYDFISVPDKFNDNIVFVFNNFSGKIS